MNERKSWSDIESENILGKIFNYSVYYWCLMFLYKNIFWCWCSLLYVEIGVYNFIIKNKEGSLCPTAYLRNYLMRFKPRLVLSHARGCQFLVLREALQFGSPVIYSWLWVLAWLETSRVISSNSYLSKLYNIINWIRLAIGTYEENVSMYYCGSYRLYYCHRFKSNWCLLKC